MVNGIGQATAAFPNNISEKCNFPAREDPASWKPLLPSLHDPKARKPAGI